MKNLRTINAKYFLMTLMILAGMSACHKEEIDQKSIGKATINHFNQSKEGDDDEEAILQGGVSYSGGGVVTNATVNLYILNTTIPFISRTSDSNGEFEMTVPYDTYFIEVIETNNNSTKTNDFTVTGNASLTIVI